MTLLSIKNAAKSYGGVPALKAASLEIEAGEVHALMGENGAGKSTLIKILAGVVVADTIEIMLHDQPIRIGNATDAFAHGFRFIHQELNVVPQLSVAENLFLGQAYPRRGGLFVDWGALNRAALATLARLGIDHINPRQRIARLSPGDKMLVKIAGTLLPNSAQEANRQEPLLYVMDEPTAALTGEESERLFTVIEELKAKGCGVLYVSHRMDEVLRICDRITVMRDGECIATKAITPTVHPSPALPASEEGDRCSSPRSRGRLGGGEWLPSKDSTLKTSAGQENPEQTKREIIQLMTGRDIRQTYPAAHQAPSEKVVLDVRSVNSDAIRNVTFQMVEGEILGVAGLAGSGQSELLRALMGVDPQKTRDVWLDGKKQGKLDPAAAWSANLAYVPPERRSQGLMLSRSIRDNVTLPHLNRLSYAGTFLNRHQEDQRTQSWGKQVGLKATGTTQLSYQLSGGNQQKVVFARALAGTPKLLLLDEPTRGVDVGAKYDIYTLIRALSAQGTAVIMASSDLSELLGMCHRILVMVEQQPSTIVEADGLTMESLLTLCYRKSSF